MKTTILLLPAVAVTAFTMAFAQSPGTPGAAGRPQSNGTVPSGAGITGSNRATSTDISNDAGTTAAAGGTATSTPAEMDAVFARLDTNRDGNISREEFRAGASWLRAMPGTPRTTGAAPNTYDTGAQSTGSATGSSNSGVKDSDKNGAPPQRR